MQEPVLISYFASHGVLNSRRFSVRNFKILPTADARNLLIIVIVTNRIKRNPMVWKFMVKSKVFVGKYPEVYHCSRSF